MMRFLAWLALGLTAISPAWSQALPVFSDTGPDAADYGAAEGYPMGGPGVTITQRTLVGTYSHYDELHPARTLPAAPTPSKLGRAPEELKLSYSFQGETQTLDSYLDRNPATGLLILRDHTILYEHYRYARTDTMRFTSQSMAKTIVAMLVGVAIADGRIRSVDDSVSIYIPELAGSEAGSTPLRALLTMSSGLHFREVYDGRDDISRLSRALMRPDSPGAAEIVTQFNTRDHPPGTLFHYAGLNTELLGITVARAVGMPLAEYLSQKIWTPVGAEAPASWTIDSRGQEIAYCCFNATLRDWGRLGVLLANDGAWNGKQLVPRSWIRDATVAQAAYLGAGVNGRKLGYGYQLWLQPGDRRGFSLRGIYGQTMLVDPATKTVLVHTAARPNATNNAGEAELGALWAALVATPPS